MFIVTCSIIAAVFWAQDGWTAGRRLLLDFRQGNAQNVRKCAEIFFTDEKTGLANGPASMARPRARQGTEKAQKLQ